jgi:hypothetical protein
MRVRDKSFLHHASANIGEVAPEWSLNRALLRHLCEEALKYEGVTAERPSLEQEGLGIPRPPPQEGLGIPRPPPQEAQQRHLHHL